MLIEYPDPQERSRRLTELRGIERRCWMQIAGFEPVYAIADEDLRAKMRPRLPRAFPALALEPASAAALKGGAALAAASTLRPTPRASILSPPRCARHCCATLSDSFC